MLKERDLTALQETLQIEPTQVVFFHITGTWAMSELGEGKLKGTGTLGDDELRELELSLRRENRNKFDPKEIKSIWKRLGKELYNNFKSIEPESIVSSELDGRRPLDVSEYLMLSGNNVREYLASENEHLENYIQGPVYVLLNSDSSQLEAPHFAAISTRLIDQLLSDPKTPIMGMQGTDTADSGFISLIDAFTFDTKLAPVVFSGGNKSITEEETDVPENVLSLAKVMGRNLGAGAFFAFHKGVFSGNDFTKFDVNERAKINGNDTFTSPHRSSRSLKQVLSLPLADRGKRSLPNKEHPIWEIAGKPGKLLAAANSVYVANLDPNSLPMHAKNILRPHTKVVVVPGHGFGNASNHMRDLIDEATKQEKLVIAVSRVFIGDTSNRYDGAALLKNPKVINGQTLNKAAAQNLGIRMALTGMNNIEGQNLVNSYLSPRNGRRSLK